MYIQKKEFSTFLYAHYVPVLVLNTVRGISKFNKKNNNKQQQQ